MLFYPTIIHKIQVPLLHRYDFPLFLKDFLNQIVIHFYGAHVMLFM